MSRFTKRWNARNATDTSVSTMLPGRHHQSIAGCTANAGQRQLGLGEEKGRHRMNGVLGVTTAPPLLTNGKQAADWLVNRNAALRRLLLQLGLITEDYGVSLNGLRDLVISSDAHYRATVAYNRARANGAHHHMAPPSTPTASQKLFSLMSASERARLRLLATLAPMTDEADFVGVEWSMDEVGMFCMADPGLVVDYAAVMVSRYTSV